MNSIQVVYRTTFLCFLQTGSCSCSCFHFSSSSSLTFLSHSISFGTFFSFGHWWHPNQIFIVLLWVCPTWRPMISYCLDHKLGSNICETRLMEEQLWEGGECYKRTIYSLGQECEWVYKENLTFLLVIGSLSLHIGLKLYLVSPLSALLQHISFGIHCQWQKNPEFLAWHLLQPQASLPSPSSSISLLQLNYFFHVLSEFSNSLPPDSSSQKTLSTIQPIKIPSSFTLDPT